MTAEKEEQETGSGQRFDAGTQEMELGERSEQTFGLDKLSLKQEVRRSFQEEEKVTSDIKDPAGFIRQAFRDAYSSLKADIRASDKLGSIKTKKIEGNGLKEAGTSSLSQIRPAAKQLQNLPPCKKTNMQDRAHFKVPKPRSPRTHVSRDRDIEDPAGFIWEAFKDAYYHLMAGVDASNIAGSIKGEGVKEAGTSRVSRIPVAAREYEYRDLPPFKKTCLRERKHRDSGDTTQDTASRFKVPKSRPPPMHESRDRAFCYKKLMTEGKVKHCDFSYDGRWLAWAGEDKRVGVMKLPRGYNAYNKEAHSSDVTDIRFCRQGSIFATSSCDGSVRIWDATRDTGSINQMIGPKRRIQSVDFHPEQRNVLCSCDDKGCISLWDTDSGCCTVRFEGASKQVRFQPGDGKLLAGVDGNVINLIDCAAGHTVSHRLDMHREEVRCVCWHKSGKYLASISEDMALVWSFEGGVEVRLLQPTGDDFLACTFHPGPGDDPIIVIGGDKYLDLWNPTVTEKPLKVRAHEGLVVSLASSPQDGYVASASHDGAVKVWKLAWVQ